MKKIYYILFIVIALACFRVEPVSASSSQIYGSITSEGIFTTNIPTSSNYNAWKECEGYFPSCVSLGSSSFTSTSTKHFNVDFENKFGFLGDETYYLYMCTAGVNCTVDDASFGYIQATRSDGVWTTDEMGVDSTYLSFTFPSVGITTASTTFDVLYEGFLSSDENVDNLSYILAQFCPLDDATDNWAIDGNADCQVFTFDSSVVEDVYFSDSFQVSIDPPNGYYLGMINYWNGVSDNTVCSWWQYGCDETSVIVGKGDSVRFNVASSTIIALPSYQLNAIDNLLHKAPWGYITLLSDLWVDVSNATSTATPNLTIVMPTSSTAFSGKSLTLWDWSYAKDLLETDTFDLINDFIVVVLWAGFVFYLLKRLKALISI